MSTASSHPSTAQHLAAIAQEAAYVEELVTAGYPLGEAARWIEAWAGPQPERLWLETALLDSILSSQALRDIL